MNAGAFLHFEHVGKYEYHLQQPSKTVDIHFLKFPSTMLSDNFQIAQRWDFDEYYAFFHWKPNLVRYRQIILLIVLLFKIIYVLVNLMSIIKGCICFGVISLKILSC